MGSGARWSLNPSSVLLGCVMLGKLLNLSGPNYSTSLVLLIEGLCEIKITMSVTVIIIIISGNDSEDPFSPLLSLSCNSRGPGHDNRVGKACKEPEARGSSSVAG